MITKLKIIFFIIIPVCIAMTGIVWILLQKDLPLFPDPGFILFPYTDEGDRFGNGTSRVEEFTMLPDKLIMRYSLHGGAQFPYVGINIGKKGLFFDISGYDELKIKIDAAKSRRLRIFVLLYIDGISDNSDYLKYLYLYKEIPLWQNEEEYTLPLKKFYIPEWWYGINNISENDRRLQRDFSKTVAILIESEAAFPLNVTDTIELKGMRFSKDTTHFLLFTGISILFYYFILFIHVVWKIYKNQLVKRMNNVIIPYKFLEVEKWEDPALKRIIEYIIDHYTIPDLSVKKVSAACSVPTYKIPVILKEKFQLSFPAYINSLRLKEGKRLLKETDMSITAIAMEIGFNNISYFNNLFRFIEDISPKEFRKKSRE
ncbi:MAG: helix-turn-helix transcriptional regulator [Spirochaetales bacterium]|nr:helix-turn-helix transcriptional regulator [Spirochaetales bacterium]